MIQEMYSEQNIFLFKIVTVLLTLTLLGLYSPLPTVAAPLFSSTETSH